MKEFGSCIIIQKKILMNKWFHIFRIDYKLTKFELCFVNDHEIMNYYSNNQEFLKESSQKSNVKSRKSAKEIYKVDK